MTMRWWRRVLPAVGGAVLAIMGLVASGEAANCGDTAGPHRRRVPCACGDTVVTNTRLRATDPVVTTACTSFAIDGALVIGADNITLDCWNRKIRGSDDEQSLGLRGIFGEQSRVSVKNCRVEFFIDGVVLRGNRNRVISTTTFGTFGGIRVRGADNWLIANRVSACQNRGLHVLDGRDNAVWDNQAANCFAGLVVESDGNWIAGNVLNDNVGPGIFVTGAHNDLIGNTANRNGNSGQLGADHGVLVAGPGNVLFGNVAHDNVGKGFCVVTGNVDAGLNRARGNGETPQADFDCETQAPALELLDLFELLD